MMKIRRMYCDRVISTLLHLIRVKHAFMHHRYRHLASIRSWRKSSRSRIHSRTKASPTASTPHATSASPSDPGPPDWFLFRVLDRARAAANPIQQHDGDVEETRERLPPQRARPDRCVARVVLRPLISSTTSRTRRGARRVPARGEGGGRDVQLHRVRPAPRTRCSRWRRYLLTTPRRATCSQGHC